MLFNSLEFWIFFLTVIGLFYSVPFRIGRLVLLGASYFFYMWWNPWLISLIIFSTSVDYFVGRRLPRCMDTRLRKLHLASSIAANLGLLAFFKYYNFFTESLTYALGLSPDSLTLKIVLPVGISFYTFQSMSYTIDIYRGKLKPVDNFWDFALFVGFFPQLVAGPIVRAGTFLPQLAAWTAPRRTRLLEGVHLLLIGMIKKTVFADRFALVADQYFAAPAQYPGLLSAWSGLLAFSLQIFFDFSGYTDIARGCGKLLGFEFPENFRRPYLAASVREFWQRWHISLSTWLRDYLYIPLGGNRLGTVRTYANLTITMLLGGLWHGASWNFVVWGAFHGVLLIAERLLKRVRRADKDPVSKVDWITYPIRMAVTFFAVNLTWVFFRCDTFSDSLLVLANLFSPDSGRLLMQPLALGLIVVAFTLTLMEEYRAVLSRIATSGALIRIPFYVLSFFTLELLSVTDEKLPFVYFQF